MVGLTLRFSIGAAGPLPEMLLDFLRLGFQVLVGATSVVWLLSGGGLMMRTRDDRDGRLGEASGRPWAFFLAHLTALAGFTGLTAIVLEGGARPLPTAIVLAAAWAGMGLATLVTWSGSGCLRADGWHCWARAGNPAGRHRGRPGDLGHRSIAESLWYPLGRSTLWVAYQLLRPFVAGPVYRPDTFDFGTSSFHVWIGPRARGTRAWASSSS